MTTSINDKMPGKKIWAVGSGKGGVGKSVIASNLSIILANLGESVVVVDLDLGNANMHTCLGIKYPRKTLSDFLKGDIKDINEIILDTPIYNLKFISGSGGILGSANLWYAQKKKLMRCFENIQVNNIVLDLGAGTAYNTIDFFLGATNQIVVTTPETTSIQSAYNFVRICIFRRLYSIFQNNFQALEIIERVKIPSPDRKIFKVQDIMEEIDKLSLPGTKEFKDFQNSFKPILIMNMVIKNFETKLGWGFKKIAKRFLDTDVDYVGSISFDSIIRESLSSEIPYIINDPKAQASNDLFSLIPKIIGNSMGSYFLKETIKRELKNTGKIYGKRIVERNTMEVDPSIYAVDKFKSDDTGDKTESKGFFNFKATTWSKIAIDIGTSSTLIYVKGRGVILKEPSLMSVEENSGKIVALGHEAKAMIGRSHSGIKIISPMESGSITDYTDVKKMIQELIKRAKKTTILIRPKVMLSIQPGLTSVEKRAFMEFVKELGAREVHLVYEPLAAAIGAGLPVDVPKASMLVNLGGGSISAIVISISGIVAISSDRIGSKILDSYIAKYIRDQYSFVIGDQTAEFIKINHGQALKIDRDKRFKVRGQDTVMRIPQTISLSTAEIRQAIAKPVKKMLKVISDLLEKIPPELSGDLVDRGMTLTGGGAYLTGFDKLITEKTGIKVQIASNAETAAVEGAGRMLDDLTLYKRFFVEDPEFQDRKEK